MDAGVDAPGAYTPKHGEVFFFDGFGEDTRGLALIYLRAIHALGYHLIYCVDRDVRALPLISEVLAANHATVVVLEGKDPCTRYQEITAMIAQYQPEIGFLDTTPWNVESVLAFQHFAGSMKRYQINLTDHAWWPGLASFDTCLEFRDFGAAVSVQERGIPREKLRKQRGIPGAPMAFVLEDPPVSSVVTNSAIACWNRRGAWDDSFRLDFGEGWVFPWGSNHLSGVEVPCRT